MLNIAKNYDSCFLTSLTSVCKYYYFFMDDGCQEEIPAEAVEDSQLLAMLVTRYTLPGIVGLQKNQADM